MLGKSREVNPQLYSVDATMSLDGEDAFRLLDTDGSGIVSKEQFLARWKELQKTLVSPQHPTGRDASKATATPVAQRKPMVSTPTATHGNNQAHRNSRRRTHPAETAHHTHPTTNNDSQSLDAVFFDSFDLSNDEDVIFSPVKPEKYTQLEYDWSITPKKSELVRRNRPNRTNHTSKAVKTTIPSPTNRTLSRPQSAADLERINLISKMQSKQRSSAAAAAARLRYSNTKSTALRSNQATALGDDDSSDSEPQEF